MAESQETLVVIPARGGSKGIQHKNKRLLFGCPLVWWVLVAAKQARLVSRIVVSTDDDEIACIAVDAGVGVIARPAELATDTSPTYLTVHHALRALRDAEKYEPEIVVLVQPTSPLTASEDIDNIVKAVYPPYRSVLGVVEDHSFLWSLDADLYGVPIGHDPRRSVMRQALDPRFKAAGLFAWPRESLREEYTFLPHPTNLVEIPKARAIDIDDMTDWTIAEHLLRRRSEA